MSVLLLLLMLNFVVVVVIIHVVLFGVVVSLDVVVIVIFILAFVNTTYKTEVVSHTLFSACVCRSRHKNSLAVLLSGIPSNSLAVLLSTLINLYSQGESPLRGVRGQTLFCAWVCWSHHPTP